MLLPSIHVQSYVALFKRICRSLRSPHVVVRANLMCLLCSLLYHMSSFMVWLQVCQAAVRTLNYDPVLQCALSKRFKPLMMPFIYPAVSRCDAKAKNFINVRRTRA